MAPVDAPVIAIVAELGFESRCAYYDFTSTLTVSPAICAHDAAASRRSTPTAAHAQERVEMGAWANRAIAFDHRTDRRRAGSDPVLAGVWVRTQDRTDRTRQMSKITVDMLFEQRELLEGLNLSESAKSQIVALGAYALSTEYIEQLRKDAIVNANCARSYADDYNQAQSDYYAHNATLFSSNASYGFRLADELERAAETPEVLKRLQENVAVSS